jgi:hypothetical protein
MICGTLILGTPHIYVFIVYVYIYIARLTYELTGVMIV